MIGVLTTEPLHFNRRSKRLSSLILSMEITLNYLSVFINRATFKLKTKDRIYSDRVARTTRMIAQ